MSLQLKKRNIKLSTVALAGAAVVATGVILVKTFPHIKSSVLCVFGSGKLKKSSDDDDSVDVGEDTLLVSEWSDENLKSFLQEVRIFYSITYVINLCNILSYRGM